MFRDFDNEYKQAHREYEQLSALYREVCWYNFETRCRTWREPWHVSLGASLIAMHGHRYTKNIASESCEFPVWYIGAVCDAPPLPPDIIFVEMKAAEAYMRFMEEPRYAPYDYAPGGVKYQKLLRESEGAAAYSELHRLGKLQSSKRNVAKLNDVAGCQQCDGLDGTTEAEAKPTSTNLLGGVRRDGHLVLEEAN